MRRRNEDDDNDENENSPAINANNSTEEEEEEADGVMHSNNSRTRMDSRSPSPPHARPLAAVVSTARSVAAAVARGTRTRTKRRTAANTTRNNSTVYSAAFDSFSDDDDLDDDNANTHQNDTTASDYSCGEEEDAQHTNSYSHNNRRRRRRRHHQHVSSAEEDDDDDDDTVTGNWSIEEEEDDHDPIATARRKNATTERVHVPSSPPRTTTTTTGSSTPNTTTTTTNSTTIPATTTASSLLTPTDLALCRALDAEYERAVEERHIHWTARYQSVRQSTVLSLLGMVLLMGTGTAFYHKQAGGYWTVPEALLFSIYTITTVGYGHLDVPDTPLFQLYTVVFIFLGIAMLTILVAQVYQCIALEASRVANGSTTTLHGNSNSSSHHHPYRQQQRRNRNGSRSGGGSRSPHRQQQHYRTPPTANCRSFVRNMDTIRNRLRETEVGRAIAVVLPFATLVVVGAVVIGLLEGWSMTEALYFACVSLTTVGFGDYYPTRTVSIWFCCLWLPFSVGFMSLYFAETAAFYMRLSDRNVQRIERVLRRRMQRAKERVARERATILRRALRGQQQQQQQMEEEQQDDEEAAPEMHHPAASSSPTAPRARKQSIAATSEDGSVDDDLSFAGVVPAMAPTPRASNETRDQHHRLATSSSHSQQRHLFGTTGFEHSNRRARIRQNAMQRHPASGGGTMATMKDVLATVHSTRSSSFRLTDPGAAFLRVAARPVLHQNGTVRRQPTFALRALVQERWAGIIATDIAGYQSSIEIKEYTLSVTIQSLQQTANKWQLPRRARKAFRAVAFEALYCVGEHALIVQGADALLALTPFAFHQIFSPLLAAFGDADTMEGWLDQTQALADVDLVVPMSPGEATAPPTRLVVPRRRAATAAATEDDSALHGECELPDIT